MLPTGVHIQDIPAELQQLLDKEKVATEFFGSLPKSHKQAYIDWVGSAKKEETRQIRAEKAIAMLLKKQKTLKIV